MQTVNRIRQNHIRCLNVQPELLATIYGNIAKVENLGYQMGSSFLESL